MLRDLFLCLGDMRVNSNPQLGVLHALFVREHNRVADTLATLNNHWDDELLFQETKKIVVAEIQHITYTEWLPRILGEFIHPFFSSLYCFFFWAKLLADVGILSIIYGYLIFLFSFPCVQVKNILPIILKVHFPYQKMAMMIR